MRIIESARQRLWPQPPGAEAWECLRLQLLHRFMWLIGGVLLLLGLRGWWDGTGFVGLCAAGLAFFMLLKAALGRWPEKRRSFAWASGLALLGLVWLPLRGWQGSPPPGIAFLPTLGMLGFLLESPLLGLVMGAGSLALLAAAGPYSGGSLLDAWHVAGAALAMLACSWAWHAILMQGWAQLVQNARWLAGQYAQREPFIKQAFVTQAQALQRLQDALQKPEPAAWGAVHAEAKAMTDQLDEARNLRRTWPDTPEDAVDEGLLRERLLVALLWVGLLLALSEQFYDLTLGLRRSWLSIAALPLQAWMLWRLRDRASPPAWMSPVVAVLGPVITLGATLPLLTHGVPEILHFWGLHIVFVGLLLGLPAAMGLLGLGSGLLAFALWSAPAPDLALLHVCGDLAVAWLISLAVCVQALRWQQDLLRLLKTRGQELALALRVRTRLLGTLFHGLANPLSAILRGSELGRSGLAQAGDLQRMRRLAGTMQTLLDEGQEALLAEGPVSSSLLRTVLLSPMVAAMQDLYAARLAEKHLSLNCEVPESLRVLAVPGLLRDNVISNLVGSAIAASSFGSRVDLLVWRDGARVVLSVRDHGPALAPGAAEALGHGREPHRESEPASNGQGLGLLLALDQLQRLGGGLELRSMDGGGVEARAFLPAA